MSEKLTKEIISELNDAWLNINIKNSEIINPFELLRTDEPDDFHMKLAWLFMNPDYFCFICKHVLNIELLPMQALILKEMWNRKFPMLVGSRGLGKAIRPDEKIRIKNGWTTIKDLKIGDQVYSSNGKLCNVIYKTELQKNLKMYKITLRDGRTIDCCEDHMWKVWDKNKNKNREKLIWSELKTKDMIDSYSITRIGKNNNGFECRYALPVNLPIVEDDEKFFELHPYVVGVLLGDGCLGHRQISLSSMDQEVIDRFTSLLPHGYILKSGNNKDYRIVRSDKSVPPFYEVCKKAGIYGYNSHTKFIPDQYKYSGVNNLTELIFGLMDTDGYSSKEGIIEYYTVSERLKNDFVDIVRSLGIQCRETIKESWIGDTRYSDCYRVSLYTDKPVFSLTRKLVYLNHTKSKAGRSKYEKVFITKIERIENGDGYCIQVDSPDHTYVTKDYIVTHNTFILSVYCLLRALLMPNRKIVVVGSAFRQSKYLHDYMEAIWKNSPILRDICDENSGPRKDVDMCRMTLNRSNIVALPIGDGCVNPYTLMTYDKSFGCMLDKHAKVWGNGKYRDIDYYLNNGVKPTKIITTRCGYSYEGTHNHAMKVLRNNEIQWVRSDQMINGDRILIDRSDRWHNGDFECTEDEAYALGAIIGDGCWTNKYQLRFATKDQEIINKINKAFKNTFYKQKDCIHWNMNGVESVTKWLTFWKLKENCCTKNKSLPETILSASRSKMTACLQGLFDTDGHVFVSTSKGGTTISVNFTNTSKRLVEQIQYILLHYGIVSTVKNRDRNPKWNTVYELGIYGKNVKLFAEKIGFYLPRKQDLLLKAVSQKKKWNSFNDDIPISGDIVEASIDRNRIIPYRLCKSKILSKKSFQQQFLQNLLPYCNDPAWQNLVNEDIYYDEIISIEDSECHTYDIHVPEGNEYCANGFFSHNSKIRGQRANDIVADEFACLRSSSIIQTDAGLIEIKDYLNGNAYNLLNINSSFETPDKIFKTPLVDVYQVETANGYSFACSSIHKVMTTNGWKLAKDLTKEDNLVLDINDYFPSEFIKTDNTVLDDNIGWLIGILLSEGTVTNRNYISVKNTDIRLIDKIKNEFPSFEWKESSKEAYKDKRGFDCKKSWEIKYSDTKFREDLYKFGLKYTTACDKTIPDKILQSPKSVVIKFLSGLYEGDGTAFNYIDNGKTRVGVSYYSSSKRLIEVLQILLLKFGIISSITIRNKNKLSNKVNYMLSCRGENAYKIYKLLDVIKWKDKFNNIDFLVKKPQIRKNGKRYILSTTIGNKNKHIGTYDSEQECVKAFEEFKKCSRPVIRVRSVTKLDEQEHLYDFHMPETHSFIANGFVQHNSMSKDIFENVIAGFAAVSASPAENVRRVAMEKKAKLLGVEAIKQSNNEMSSKGNQIIISGTAYYDFNHFADYWKKWKAILNTKGDPHKIRTELFNGEEPPGSFNWKDYSIIRIPVDLVPEGFMDDGQIARSKATVHNGIYLMEFGAVFTKDSQGFFKRSLIESCVGSEINPIKLSSGEVFFDPQIKGVSNRKYIMGVDPASEVDNFSIIIIELLADHRRIVYCWTTTRKEHIERVKKGLVSENNFYSYCARKIRDLMNLFPICHIAIDSQGGGVSVSEALHDINQLKAGEVPIWPIIEEDNEKPSDDEQGLHILEMCNFAKYDWYCEANHGMRKDFEDKALLFPRFDPVTIGLSIEEDKINNRLYDTLEDCVMEIEELKNELSLIEMTKTQNGRDRWDTPEVKIGVGKKKRLRKDRYSSLLMANMAARIIANTKAQDPYVSYGGFAASSGKNADKKSEYIGPAWFTEAMRNVY